MIGQDLVKSESIFPDGLVEGWSRKLTMKDGGTDAPYLTLASTDSEHEPSYDLKSHLGIQFETLLLGS